MEANLPAGFQLDEPLETDVSLPKGFELDEDKYGGVTGAAKAGLAGLARGATLGASDVLLTKTGLVEPQTLKGLKEENPASSIAGEIGSVFLPGPSIAGAIGKLGKATVEGAKAIKAAKAIETSTRAGKVLADVGAHALGSAVEGAVYAGVGNTLTEYALGDPNLNGEKILSHFGHGALMGGALGGAIKGVSIGVPASIKAAKDALVGIRNTVVGTGVKDAGIVGKFTSEDVTDALANRMVNLDKNAGQLLADDTAKGINTLKNNIESTVKQLNKDIRPEVLKAEILTASPERVALAAQENVAEMGKVLEVMKSRPAIYSPNATAKLQDLKDEVERQLKDADPAKVFEVLRDAKQRTQKLVYTKIPTETTQDTIAAIKPIADRLNSSLKNPEIFGEAGSSLAAHDEMLSKLYDFVSPGYRLETDFEKAFMTIKGKGIRAKKEIDPRKMEIALKQGNTILGQQKKEALNGYLNTLKDLPDHLETTYQNVPNAKFNRAELANRIDNAELSAEEAYEKYLAGVENRKNKLGFGDFLTGTLAVSNPVVGAILGAYNVATRPREFINKLATIEDLIGKTTVKIEKGAKAVFEPTIKNLDRAKGAISKQLDDDHNDKNEKLLEDLSLLNNNPDALMERLNASTQSIYDAAPDTTASTQQAIMRANQFLMSKIPNRPQTNPFEAKYVPSKMELAQFQRYVEIVEDPMLALDQVAAHTILPETIETLQVVYPSLYESMKQSLLNQATTRLAKKDPIPYQTKQAIGMFIGMPLDQSMTPDAVTGNQMAFSQAPEPMGTPKVSKNNIQKMTLANRTGMGRSEKDA